MKKKIQNQKDDRKDSNKNLPIFTLINKRFNKIILQGYRFGLCVIKNLQNISGDWNSLNKGEIMNFEDIFDNDKDILLN